MGSALAAFAPRAVLAREKLAAWLPANLSLYKGSPCDLQGFVLAYFGTAEKLREVSCGDDLKILAANVSLLQKIGLAVTPVFIFTEGTGENVKTYIDPPGSVFAAVTGTQADVIDFAHGNRLAFYQRKQGRVVTHTQYVHLFAPDGQKLETDIAGADSVDLFAHAIRSYGGSQSECTPPARKPEEDLEAWQGPPIS